ncbi:ABC transporter substrate-binding protein [Acetobacteraceae bacterium H6797]|nr:ABC transporter substrate-binding protein [Acetobacteraceae bacterium H6797]
MFRRSLLGAAATSTALLGAPRFVRATSATTLRFIPVIDLAFTDPIYSGAFVSRNHGFMVFDTLYGINSKMEVSPQMVEGHVVENDGKLWKLTLRDGLTWHDGEKVTAKDCVASINRWAKRDALGAALMVATEDLSAADDKTIVFRLKRPFPLLPMALGKAATPACFMMPERLANTDPFKQIPEIIGSGPFRFVANERVPGAKNVYQKFEGYKPRESGVSDWTAGPKIVHYDRVEWTTMPDAATGASAVQTGEQDWQETTPHDLLPLLRRNRNVTIDVLDQLGFTCGMRVNTLQPPFNNPAIRRALLGAIDQKAVMTAVAGEDPAFQYTPIGYFAPGTPMASDAGMEVFKGPRDYDKVKRDLAAAGYKGEKVVILVPADSLAQKPLGDVAADLMRQAGMNVDYQAMDFGAVLTRRNRKTPVEEGGWSAFVGNWQGIDWLNPASHQLLRGDASYPGWFESRKLEALREQWLAAPDTESQKRIAAEVQLTAFDEVPYYPLGLYRQPTAYRKNITGVNRGTVTFWNVRPA